MVVHFTLGKSLWKNSGDRNGAEKKNKREARLKFQLFLARVQHLFSGYGLRIFVTNIESAGNATAHPACSLNLFYSYSITLGYAPAQ